MKKVRLYTLLGAGLVAGAIGYVVLMVAGGLIMVSEADGSP